MSSGFCGNLNIVMCEYLNACTYFSEFQARVARQFIEGGMETANSDPQEPQRNALGILKTKGKKQVVPNIRAGNTKSGTTSASGLSH